MRVFSIENLIDPREATLDDGGAQSRAHSVFSTRDDQRALAYAFGARLVEVWWHALTKAAGSPMSLRAPFAAFGSAVLPASARQMADQLGRTSATIDTASATYRIGLAYTGMLPADMRAKLGIFYTPPALAARLIAQASKAGVDWSRCRVLDPACGGGAFLAPVAARILNELDGCRPGLLMENLGDRIRGYDIDPFGAWLSQVTLDALLLPLAQSSGRQLPCVVQVRDFLECEPPDERFDLVIANPPYGRVRLDAAGRARFKRSLYGHANLYGLFTDRALGFARAGAVIAYVTPTSFLAGEYFKNLRTLLGREAPPATMDFVNGRKGVFEDVLQETILATYRVGASRSEFEVCEIAPGDDREITVKTIGKASLPGDPSRPWIMARDPGHSRFANAFEHMPDRLADWGYEVSTGPLVWNRHKEQLADHPGSGRYPLIWAEAISAGGQFEWRAEKRNHAPYLEVRGGDDWLMTDRPCVLLQRTTAKEQRRRLIAALLPRSFLARHGAVVVENHVNIIRPTNDRPAVPVELLAAFLNSEVADSVFRCVSGSVAVSAYELESMPLPAPDALKRSVRGCVDRDSIETAFADLYDRPH